MTAKGRTKKSIEIKNEDSQQCDAWNIRSILSNIFAYVDRKDLIEFSTVCKKWNNVINPIIHKTIKLNLNYSALFGSSGSTDNTDKNNAELIECISNNAKHAPFVKEFRYNYGLEPGRTIEFFQIFRFISNLTIGFCDISQDLFLNMISPLTQLQELNLSGLKINNINRGKFYNEVVQLPPTLKKLKLNSIRLINNPELFVQTVNSHSNLVEFSFTLNTNYEFLEPFYKPYSNLVNFEYTNQQIQNPKFLINIFEQNPQIATFKLSLQYWNSEFINYISRILTNLEEVNFMELGFGFGFGNYDYPDINFKLSQPTKIKKFKTDLVGLSNLSLNSILINCPHLVELGLNRYAFSNPPVFVKFLNISDFVNLIKLNIDYYILDKGAFGTLLSNCPHLSELVINLPVEWKEMIKSIYDKCANLQSLEIRTLNMIYSRERDAFLQEFYENEFFTSSPKCKFTLTRLIFNGFRAVDSKSEYFGNFKSLKSIKYPPQPILSYDKKHQVEIDMDLWPGYRLLKINYLAGYGAEFKRYKVNN